MMQRLRGGAAFTTMWWLTEEHVGVAVLWGARGSGGAVGSPWTWRWWGARGRGGAMGAVE